MLGSIRALGFTAFLLFATNLARAQPVIPPPPETPLEVALATARSAVQNGELDVAASAYARALELDEDPSLLCEAAELLLSLHRATEARALADRALATTVVPEVRKRAQSVVIRSRRFEPQIVSSPAQVTAEPTTRAMPTLPHADPPTPPVQEHGRPRFPILRAIIEAIVDR